MIYHLPCEANLILTKSVEERLSTTPPKASCNRVICLFFLIQVSAAATLHILYYYEARSCQKEKKTQLYFSQGIINSDNDNNDNIK